MVVAKATGKSLEIPPLFGLFALNIPLDSMGNDGGITSIHYYH